VKNLEVRLAAQEVGVYLWQIAEKLNVTDSTFSKRLRREFSTDMKQRVIDIIHDLKGSDSCERDINR